MAHFSVIEPGFSLNELPAKPEPYEYEALALYLKTKFRKGVESYQKFLNVKKELDDLINAVDAINQANKKGTAKPDFKIYSNALIALNKKIADGLNKKITQASKDDRLRDYLGIYVFDSINNSFKNIVEKTTALQEKIQLIKIGPTVNLIESVIKAADEAKDAALASGLDAKNHIILQANKVAKDGYKLAASAGKDGAIKQQSLAEAAKKVKNISEAAAAAKEANDYYEAIKLVIAKDPMTKADVDAAEKAKDLAQKAYEEVLKDQPAHEAEKIAAKDVDRVTNSFFMLDFHINNLPQYF